MGQLGEWYPQSVVGRPTKVGWGSELCWLGQDFVVGDPIGKKDPARGNVAGLSKMCFFVENGAIFAIFFFVFALGALLGVHTENT